MENPDYYVYCDVQRPGSYPSSEKWEHHTRRSYFLVSRGGGNNVAASNIKPRFMMVAWQKDSIYRNSENGIEDICYVYPSSENDVGNYILARPLGGNKEYALSGKDSLRELTEEERTNVERRVRELEREREIANLSEEITKLRQKIAGQNRQLERLEKQLLEVSADSETTP